MNNLKNYLQIILNLLRSKTKWKQLKREDVKN